MNKEVVDQAKEIVRASPNSVPASLVELEDRPLTELLTRTQWNDRRLPEEKTPLELARAAARYLAESKASTEQRNYDRDLADRIVRESRRQ